MNLPLRIIPVGLCLLLAASPAARPEAVALPTPPPLAEELARLKPASLLPTSGAAEFAFHDHTHGTPGATFTPLPETGPGMLAYRAEVPVRGKNNYDVETKFKVAAPVRKGDVVFARFLARAPVARQESGEGAVGFTFARRVEPYEKSVSLTVTPGAEWTLFQIPFTVANDFAAGEAAVAFTFGDLAQTVEISGLEVLNFGSTARIEQFPKIRFTYRGREADAAWRTAALRRIEEIRTAPITVRATDAAGRPLAGVRVEADLAQSEFLWGSAVDDKMVVADTPEAERYRAAIPELFNTVVIENGLKWGSWANGGPERQAFALKALDWIQQRGLRHKGHNLIWPSWKFSPRGLKDLPDLPVALPGLIHEHITEMIGVTKGRSFAWDVVNEPLHERDYFTHLPEVAMADWFKLAHSLDPDLQLFINEYSMLNGAGSPGNIARYREIIGTLRRAGAPIGGIGIQGHVGQQPRAPEQVLSDLDLIAAEGLPVQITEFDVNTPDESLQADYTRDFLIACYSHPTMTGFIMWGFWQSRHWKPDAAMFRPDWSEKPNAAVWREWVLGRWKTRVNAVTAADGAVTSRGHLGRYRVSVTHGGNVQQRELVLTRAGAEIAVRFP